MYKLTSTTSILRTADNASIPADPANSDYLRYLMWIDEGNTPEPVPVPTDAEQEKATQAALTSALNNHLNAVAGERSYDDRFTCSLRAGYPGPFQPEGQAFAAWMDDCNMLAYQIMSEVKQGLRQIPTESELIAALPLIEWPPSPVPVGA